MDGAEEGREEERKTVEGRKVPPPRIFVPDAAVVSYIAGKKPHPSINTMQYIQNRKLILHKPSHQSTRNFVPSAGNYRLNYMGRGGVAALRSRLISYKQTHRIN